MAGSSYNSSSPKPSQRKVASHANFIEALKSSSGTIAKDFRKGITEDLIAGGGQQIVDTLTNTNSNRDTNSENFDFSEYLHSAEKQTIARERIKYQYEQSETIIFNRRQKEVDKKIESIRIELKKIASEIVYLDSAIDNAINQEVINPGTYHLNFFEKLLEFLHHMRKRVVESRHWASIQSQRSTTKSYYWRMSGKKAGGTMFSQSQERTVATQTG